MSNIKLTYEQEVSILFYIENFLGKGPKEMDRNILYEIFNYFNPKEGRGPHVCGCLDKDTVNKVSKMIDGYTFSDEIRETPRFAALLPHLAIVKEEAGKEVEIEDNVGMDKIDITELNKKLEEFSNMKGDDTIQSRVTHGEAKPVPVKPVRKTRKKK
jgi:hypothetical protein